MGLSRNHAYDIRSLAQEPLNKHHNLQFDRNLALIFFHFHPLQRVNECGEMLQKWLPEDALNDPQ